MFGKTKPQNFQNKNDDDDDDGGAQQGEDDDGFPGDESDKHDREENPNAPSKAVLFLVSKKSRLNASIFVKLFQNDMEYVLKLC